MWNSISLKLLLVSENYVPDNFSLGNWINLSPYLYEKSKSAIRTSATWSSKTQAEEWKTKSHNNKNISVLLFQKMIGTQSELYKVQDK